MVGELSLRRSSHPLDPRSLQSFSDRLDWIRSALERAESIPSSHLRTDEDRICLRLYLEQLRGYVNNFHHRSFLCCVNNIEGPHTDLSRYASYLPLHKPSDGTFYQSFLNAISIQLSEVRSLLEQGLNEGRTPPKISVEMVPTQLRSIVQNKGKAFRDPIVSAPEGVFTDESLNDAQQTIDHSVLPAFETLATYIETNYVPNLREEISAVKGYPDGEEYYADCLAFHTTTNMTYDEIHRLGLNEVERIDGLMESVASKAGFDSAKSYKDYLRTAKEFSPPSEEWLLSHYRDITGRIAPELLKIIRLDTLPRMPFRIIKTPSENAPTAPTAYYLAGASDGSRPGTFFINTHNLPEIRTYECESLALHESIPGHHTQSSIQMETTPDFESFRKYCDDRRYFESPCKFPFYTGYIEGWALHCETTLGYELGSNSSSSNGLYETLSSVMGQLSNEMFRACRLVVDTGMHAMGWERSRAVEYMSEHTAMSENEVKVEATRYITWPGQACAYKVGEIKINELRERAKSKLGERFDPRDFYDVVLLPGPVSLIMLEEAVDEYIEKMNK